MKIAKEKYNMIGMDTGILVFITLFIILERNQENIHEGILVLLGGATFYSFFLIQGIAHILGGYSWKNCVPGGNGFRKDKNPVKFWTDVIMEQAFGLMLFGLAITSFVMGWYK